MHRAAVGIRKVVFESDDGLRIIQFDRPAKGRMEHMGTRAGVILMDETPVRAYDPASARLQGSVGILGYDHMTHQDLVGQGKRPVVLICHATGSDALHALLAIAQQAPMTEDGSSQPVARR